MIHSLKKAVEFQFTFEQHEFELSRWTNMRIFFSVLIHGSA